MDDISAEETISMWIHENQGAAPADGSIDNVHYQLNQRENGL